MSDYNPTDLRGQQDAKREEDARKRLLRQTEIGDLKWLMSSPRGRRLMWRLLQMSGQFRISFDQNAMRMAFNEGNRNIGLQWLDELMKVCPEQYPVMLKEYDDDRDGNGKQSN